MLVCENELEVGTKSRGYRTTIFISATFASANWGAEDNVWPKSSLQNTAAQMIGDVPPIGVRYRAPVPTYHRQVTHQSQS